MPSPFVVTVVPTSLTLTPGSQNGSFDVTVSNKSGRALTARAVRVIDPRTAAAMIVPRDKDEFPLAIGETKKVTYGVSVPANATPQVVKCRWDFVDVANPDEFFTQGPTGAVTVERLSVPVGKPWWKKTFPYAVAAILVLGIGFGVYKVVKHDNKVPVPKVVGLVWDSAGARLSSAGLVVANLKPSDIVPTNNQQLHETVKSITPTDSVLNKGTTVSLTVYQFVPPPPPPPAHGGIVVRPPRADMTKWLQTLNGRNATRRIVPPPVRPPRD